MMNHAGFYETTEEEYGVKLFQQQLNWISLC